MVPGNVPVQVNVVPAPLPPPNVICLVELALYVPPERVKFLLITEVPAPALKVPPETVNALSMVKVVVP